MSTPDLFDSWNTYEKVVANDYMHHRDFFVALVQEVKAGASRFTTTSGSISPKAHCDVRARDSCLPG
jgi:hypothetical protein